MEKCFHIVCFGDSNTWGYDAITNGRFGDGVRWPRCLQNYLGNQYLVYEEGISGRTTVFEDPLNEGLCGIRSLATVLGTHNPVDLLIVMLGTNDTKERFSASPQNIADGIDRIIVKAKGLPVWANEPSILIVAPMIIGKGCYTSFVSGEMGKGCVEKSERLPALFKEIAERNHCKFLDSNPYVKADQIDYMHFDSNSHKTFAEALCPVIIKILNNENKGQ